MHDTKVGIVVRADLPVWQKLNVAAFLATGVAAAAPDSILMHNQNAVINRVPCKVALAHQKGIFHFCQSK